MLSYQAAMRRRTLFVEPEPGRQCFAIKTALADLKGSSPVASPLAFSMRQESRTLTLREKKFQNLKNATESGRVLLSDRKTWFGHLTTPNLVKSVSTFRHGSFHPSCTMQHLTFSTDNSCCSHPEFQHGGNLYAGPASRGLST